MDDSVAKPKRSLIPWQINIEVAPSDKEEVEEFLDGLGQPCQDMIKM